MAVLAGFGKLQTLPERQTDFVFTATAEGSLLLYALIAAVIVVGFLAWRRFRKRRKRE
jgi:cell division protein FtsW (lipid II flippase)